MSEIPVVLTTPQGARAEILAHGAHVTSWIPAGGQERLFLSGASEFGPDSSIRGGVPVIFPQFGGNGSLPKHGFVRKMDWDLLSADQSSARFGLNDSPASRELWPYRFTCALAVRLADHAIEIELSVTNPGEEPFSFTAALHTYLRVAEIRETWVEGLGGCAYLDTVGPYTERVQSEETLRFTGEVDRIYWKPPRRLVLHEKERLLTLESETFPHAVVWNPWIEKSAALADMEAEGYRRMLCIEAVATGSPILLQPGQRWIGLQRLSA